MIMTGGCLYDRTSILWQNALQVNTRVEQVRIPGEEYHEKNSTLEGPNFMTQVRHRKLPAAVLSFQDRPDIVRVGRWHNGRP